MLRVFASLFRDSLVYGVANIIQKLAPFVIIPIITTHLGKTAFKLYDVAFVYTYLSAALIILGLDSAASVFYFDQRKTHFNKRQVLSYAFFLQIISVIAYLLVFYPFRERIAGWLFANDDLVKQYWLLALLIIPGYICLNYGLYVLLWQKKKWPYVFICFLQSALSIAGVYFAVMFNAGDIKSVFLVLIASMTISGLACITFNRKDIFTSILPLNRVLIQKLLLFGLPFAFTGFFRLLIPSIDRFFLIHFHYGNELPQYVLASKISSFINVANYAFVLAFTPYSLNKINEDNAEAEISDVFSFILIGAFVMVPILLVFKSVLIDFFADASYQKAERLLPFFFFGWIFDLFAYFSMLGVYKSQRSGVIIFILVVGVSLIVLLNLMLVPVFGLYGAAIAFFLTKLLLFVGPFFYLKRFFKLHIKLQTFLILFAITAFCSFLAYVVNFYSYIIFVCVLLVLVFLYIKRTYGLQLVQSIFNRPSQ